MKLYKEYFNEYEKLYQVSLIYSRKKQLKQLLHSNKLYHIQKSRKGKLKTYSLKYSLYTFMEPCSLFEVII